MEIDKMKVKILLAENNMNQGDLAEKIEMSKTQISRILGNSKKNSCIPGTKTVYKIAKALNVKVKDIVKI